MSAPKLLTVPDVTGEHTTCLACTNGHRRLFSIVRVGADTDHRFEVRCKDVVLHCGTDLAKAVEAYNKVDTQ